MSARHGEARQVAGQVWAETRRPTKDSLIVHCLSRAYLAANGWKGDDADVGGRRLKVNQWKAARVAPKATRVALFIASWATAMRSESRDEYTITEYARFWRETERHVYRLQSEFRELWPGLETPNEIAAQLVRQKGLKLESDTAGKPAPFSIAAEVMA